jgi:hypothetical protein
MQNCYVCYAVRCQYEWTSGGPTAMLQGRVWWLSVLLTYSIKRTWPWICGTHQRTTRTARKDPVDVQSVSEIVRLYFLPILRSYNFSWSGARKRTVTPDNLSSR